MPHKFSLKIKLKKNIMKVKLTPLFFIFCIFNVAASDISQYNKYWIFFNNKGQNDYRFRNNDFSAQMIQISDKSLVRRLKFSNSEFLFDYKDIPVFSEYIAKLENQGVQIFAKSRWLNAVSASLTETQLNRLVESDFIKSISKVQKYQAIPIQSNVLSGLNKSFDDTIYGYSLTQNEMIAVPQVHALGLSGKGILIGLIDSGFLHDSHACFSHVSILDEYDFVFEDDTTANQIEDADDQHNHGTSVFSVIAGYDEENLIGPAYHADYLLAKTEYTPTENQIEEDYWIEALEWMERKGADVISSSLGYSEFDNGDNYTYEDMDGNTALTTIAADIAVSKGVVVVTSAGNERNNSWKYITAPADADSVIAVGAVHLQNNIAYFSSVGPTADGRIKPDVVAMGMTVAAANPNSSNDYYYVQGTSFSAPQVAGVAALMLEAHPSLEPMQIREALCRTADRAESPDSLYGWGLINALDAVFYHGPIVKNVTIKRLLNPDRNRVLIDLQVTEQVPELVQCHFRNNSTSSFTSASMNLLKIDESVQYYFDLDGDYRLNQFECSFAIQDSLESLFQLPVNAPLITYSTFVSDDSPFYIAYNDSSSKPVQVYPVYPNPFNPSHTSVKIDLDLAVTTHVSVDVFNVLGAHVITLIDQSVTRGSNIQIEWDGRNRLGSYVATGVYIISVKTSSTQHNRKVLILK